MNNCKAVEFLQFVSYSQQKDALRIRFGTQRPGSYMFFQARAAYKRAREEITLSVNDTSAVDYLTAMRLISQCRIGDCSCSNLWYCITESFEEAMISRSDIAIGLKDPWAIANDYL
jgi:hypothetical protein